MPDEVIYDTLASGTSATQLSFFTHTQGNDGVATTNLSEKNKLRQPFELQQIIVHPSSDLDTTDYVKLTEDAALRIYIDGAGYVIEVPLFMCLSDVRAESHGGNATLTADQYAIGRMSGQGFVLNEPIPIPQDTTFNVYIELGTAFSTSTDITVALRGRKESFASV